jgi:hypothetical protein
MLYKLGRFLQLVGLILVPAAIAGNIAPGTPLNLRDMLTLSVAGILVFGLGYVMQQAGRNR